MSKIKYSLKNVHIAKHEEKTPGAITFATPVHVPGAVALAVEPQGEESTFYADGEEYWDGTSNNGYAGTLNMADMPEWFYEQILGEVLDTATKTLAETGDVTEKIPFALLFEVEGDKKGTKFCYYKTTCGRIAHNANTKTGTITPDTDTLNVKMVKMPGLVVRRKTTAETPQDVYDNWYKSVPVPTLITPANSESKVSG